MTRILTSITLILTLCFASAQQQKELITNLSSQNLVVGEIGYFNLVFHNVNPKQSPPEHIDLGNGIRLTQRGFQQQIINGDRYYIFQYPITDLKPGNYSIPSIQLELDGKPAQSQAAEITIHPLSSLTRQRFKLDAKTIDAYSTLFLPKKSLFPGEAINLEYKIYIPASLNPQGWGLPKPENVKNCTAWRFDAPRSNNEVGKAYINNALYYVASYSTVLSPIKSGKATYGPLETNLIIAPSGVSSRFGFSRRQTAEMPITSELITLDITPFPSTPPAEFNGAVGNFTLSSELPSDSSISLNDSITATVTIAGAGNLPDILEPILEDSATWTVIDVSKVEQGDERKKLVGKVQFTYILQPKRGAKALPRFTFCHFDPEAQEFIINTTATSPITITLPKANGTAVLADPDSPTENMQDILGPLAEPDLSAPGAATPLLTTIKHLPVWSWNAFPVLILLGMVAIAATRKSADKSNARKAKELRLKDLKELSSLDDSQFLKAAGSYVERWFPNNQDAATILNLRDSQCFLPDTKKSLDPKKRSAILQLLKKLSVFICLALPLAQPAQAESPKSPSTSDAVDPFDAWQTGDFTAANTAYKALAEQHPDSADILYNLGNTYYKTNQPGKAALYYLRALKIQPNHHEANKNLAFTQKTQGSVTAPQLDGLDAFLAPIPPELLRQSAYAFLWLLALAIIALKLFTLRTGKFITAITIICLAPILSGLFIYAWWAHPTRNNLHLGPPAVITSYTPLLTDPIDFSGKELEQKTIINAPPASPCQILAQRGSWLYVQLANGSRGWLPANSATKI